jgi:hypothetical protein
MPHYDKLHQEIRSSKNTVRNQYEYCNAKDMPEILTTFFDV